MNTPGRFSSARVTSPATSKPRDFTGLAAAVGARVHVDVTIPRTQIKGRMRLVVRHEVAALRSETYAFFAAEERAVTPATLALPAVLEDWNAEIAVRHLAIAVRDPADESKPLASLDEWRELDDDQIGALLGEYKDLGARLDPIALDTHLTSEEEAALRAAAKKGDVEILMSFGCLKLAIFATTSADPPAS